MLSIYNTYLEDYKTLKLQVEGEVDASSSIQLDEALQAAMLEHENIIVDLERLDYISSAGLGVFMSMIQLVESENKKFVIYGLQQTVLEVFQILGLDQLMTFKQAKAEALKLIHENA